MRWFVNKVKFISSGSSYSKGDSIKNGHVVQYTFYTEDFTEVDWQEEKVMMTRQLLYCEEDDAPEFRTPSMSVKVS
jgi:diphthamide synthase subunit DPH2